MERLWIGTGSIHRASQNIELCKASQAFFSLVPRLKFADFIQIFASTTAEAVSDFFNQVKEHDVTIQRSILLVFLDHRANVLIQLTASCHQDWLIFHGSELLQESKLPQESKLSEESKLPQKTEQEVTSLQQQVFMLKGIFDGLADPLFVKDEQHRWLYLNKAMCQLMRVGPDDYIGKSDFDFFPEKEARWFWQKDTEVFLSKTPIENEEVFTDGEGITHTILTKKVVAHLDDGQLILVGIIRDITQRKLAEGELVKGKATETNLNECFE